MRLKRLHDFPDSPRTWISTMERLNPDFTFICPNLNISEKPEIDLVKVIHELIRQICNEESVFLIGSGMGGILAWAGKSHFR